MIFKRNKTLFKKIKPLCLWNERDFEYIKEMEKGIGEIIKYFHLITFEIKSDEEANVLLLEIVETLPVEYNANTGKFKAFGIQEHFLESWNDKSYSDEEILFVCINNLMKLVNNRNDLIGHDGPCEEIRLKKILCNKCYDERYHKIMILGAKEKPKYCIECNIRLNEMAEENKKKEPFCAVCHQKKLLHTYNALCHYIKRGKKLSKEHKRFLEIYISILYYEIRRLKNGQWYME